MLSSAIVGDAFMACTRHEEASNEIDEAQMHVVAGSKRRQGRAGTITKMG